MPNSWKLSQFSDKRPKKIKKGTEFPMVSCLAIQVAMIRRVWVRPARQVIIPSHTSYHLNHKSATTTHVLSIMPDIHYIQHPDCNNHNWLDQMSKFLRWYFEIIFFHWLYHDTLKLSDNFDCIMIQSVSISEMKEAWNGSSLLHLPCLYHFGYVAWLYHDT